ncbi:MAG TPA: DUF4365 domain-containing protein [Polyangiaceae bacterium]|nr:DUF4365 domain-containing protein [Polyangiaceae bacterium]
MHGTQQQEKCSEVYLHAVASSVGYVLARPELDHDKVDWVVSSRQRRRPRVEVQLKSTGTHNLDTDGVRYAVDLELYDRLRMVDLLVPIILVVVLLPANLDHWLTHTEEQIVLRQSAYWASLRGAEPTINKTSVTVALPRANILNPSGLAAIMNRISEGGLP